MASFDLVRHHGANDSVFLYAFDLIELNGDDLRRDPLEVRKAKLASVLAKAGPGMRFNEHIEGDGPTVFAHACKLGLEGIVSKRLGSPYRSGPIERLPEVQEPGRASGETGRRGRLGQMSCCCSSAPQQAGRPASGTMTITTCWPMVLSSAAS